ncbi:endopeptidase La [Kangiella sediminilitoris]|uniref:Lon protease n=1 Tax=Kangiella sediminilitoris TaxID=1144748 RepID=A0A1B3B989_9GAMM|nr:endopeptidase La [Kangiella sediminilitoris]AOE49345.1 peptidase [Kangiella sediminilitoris]
MPLETKELPLLPLRDVVVFPHMVIPLFVGREKSIQALEEATNGDKQVMLVAQKEATEDMPDADQVYDYGCVATILQMLKLPDGNVKVLVEGVQRAKVDRFVQLDPMFIAEVSLIDNQQGEEDQEDALARAALNSFDKYVKLNKKIPSEILTTLSGIENPSRLADSIAAHMSLSIEDKQEILQMESVVERLEHLMSKMESEMDLLEVEKRIRGRVKNQMEKNQREYYLNEQIKAIQKELGDGEETASEHEELAKKIEEAGMTKEAKEKAEAELKKLKMMSPMSAEATVVRGYIDWLLGVPWKKRSRVKHDLVKAEEVLDEDHYGLEKIKDRILEYLAVQQRVKKLKGPVLCLVGPPGVGKTSLGQSIARATGRKYVRMALGGVRDEAEIRGHRRTYIGAMPGKLMQRMSKVGVKNPLFLLDEIDKMSMDMRGDPSSALLEVLDPEQNHTFSDHYLEVDYDLSEVMFIATSNSMNIPAPLLDRMEVIRIPGYTEDEKVEIAKRYLLPKQIKNAGLKKNELDLSEDALRSIIRYYTRESGVRNLEREISKVCRKTVKEQLLATKAKKTVKVTDKNIDKYLGVQRFDYGRAGENNKVGQVTGLAWTSVGGELLTIESVVVNGKGKTVFTGQLGDVMKESIQAAMTVVRSRCLALGIEPDFYEKKDLHIHVPEGATPKDGPSAGIGMCTALISSLTDIPVRKDVAMTGEITLRGEVLPIGGLKEKLLAAHRGGIKTVIIPKENERNLEDIPKNIKQDLKIVAVKWIDEVIDIALERLPEPISSPVGSKPESAPAEKGEQNKIQPH